MQAFFERILEKYGKSFGVAFGLGMLFALLALTPTAGAQSNGAVDRAQEVRTQAEERAAERTDRQVQRQEAQAERQELREARLTEKKLEICEKRQEKIQNIMARIADRGERHLDVFTKISDRTQTFYSEKGLSVANYDELVAAVEEKKLEAEVQVQIIRDSSTTFECDGTNPVGAAGVFKESLQAQIAALQEYRTAIKDLIVGIRANAEAQEAEETDNTENETDETVTEEDTTNDTPTESETIEEGQN